MTKPNTLKHDVNFLFEMGNIRFIERMWKRFLRDDMANLAEHHFRTFWIAMVIASHEEGDIDTGKIAKMVLIHDIAESRVGDVDYLARQYVERNEELAMNDILGGTGVKEEFYALWQEYEKRESIEAKIAKDADNLDVDFELTEQAAKGSQLRNIKHESRVFVAREKLYTQTAKDIFALVVDANPHEWHWESRNRRKHGDWQK